MRDNLLKSLSGNLSNEFSDEQSITRIGEKLAVFLEAVNSGTTPPHPEILILELPVQDHEMARSCFDMIDLLKELELDRQIE